MYSEIFVSRFSSFCLILAAAFNFFDAIFAASALSLLVLGVNGIAGVVFVIVIMLVVAMIVMLPAVIALYFQRNGKYALCISVSFSIVAISSALIIAEGASAIATTMQFPLIILQEILALST